MARPPGSFFAVMAARTSRETFMNSLTPSLALAWFWPWPWFWP